jgi:hypothetical protein
MTATFSIPVSVVAGLRIGECPASCARHDADADDIRERAHAAILAG